MPELKVLDASRAPPCVRPDDIAKFDIAYHAVLHHFGLADREDGATLMVAKRIVDLAILGERDPERLTAAIVEALAK